MRIVHALAVVATGAAIAGAATGITYAATTSSGSVHACANSKGTLRLLDSHGRCPSHFSKVTISERGPRGKTGKTGPAGPGAIRLVVHSLGGLVTKESAPIAGTGLTVEVLCSPADNAQVYINLNSAGSPFTIEGTGSYVGPDAGQVSYLPLLGNTPIVMSFDQTAMEFAAAQNGEPHSVEFTTTNGTVYANVLVTQGRHLFSIQLGAYQDSNSCDSHALVTPAG